MSLRARFTLLLVVAVLLVMTVASLVTVHLVRTSMEARFADVMAEKVEITTRLFQLDPTAATKLMLEVGPAPKPEEIDGPRTAAISRLLQTRGHAEKAALVWHVDRHGERIGHVVVEIGDGRWAYLGFPMRDTLPLFPLFTYLGLVGLGATAIALYTSGMIMRPLRLLEHAVSRVGADGMIPHVPERGPAELRASASVINRLSVRLNSAIASRMRVVAAAGHDMRTPMTRMRLRAEFVVDADERAAWLADLDELDHMADSAIQLVREEVGAAGAGRVRIDNLVAEVMLEMQDAGLPIILHGILQKAEVSGSSFALKRALRNLFVNAATHGQGASIALKVMDSAVILKVLDRGPGIPSELLTQVFEPFFRVDQARRQTVPGAGLGLAIAREIIEKHGGAIWIWNRDHGGLEQTVTLPLRSPSEPSL